MPGQQQEKAFISQSGFYKESLCSSVLSSTSAITDANGSLTQHVLYFAYGEQFVDEHRNSTNSPYLFNGKEYDEETGRYYYGARYYDPRISLWIGVDPLAGKYPNMSSYNYCADNPVLLIDPSGKIIEPTVRSYVFWFGYTPMVFQTYPNFTSRSHGKAFNSTLVEMTRQSSIFNAVYNQLADPKNSNSYKITEKNITQGGVPGALNKNNIDANGSYDASTKTITLNYDELKNINGYSSKSTIFEEIFHAGQDEFYSGEQPSKIDIEVEAKIAKAIEGFGDFTYPGFDTFVKNLKGGNVTQKELDIFKSHVRDYAKYEISPNYIKSKMQNGMSKSDAEKHYGMGSFTGIMPYLEKLINKSLLIAEP